jgi:hypothetical protein
MDISISLYRLVPASYIDTLNDLLAREGHAPTDYATANHHYFAGYTTVEACRLIMIPRSAR